MIVEITDETNVAQAWGILPVTWSFGTTMGSVFLIYCVLIICTKSVSRPLIGGVLAKPVEGFPGIFGESAFLKKYPYFLPCSVSASICAFSWLMVLFFMTEVNGIPLNLNHAYGFHADYETSNDSDAIPFRWKKQRR